MRINLLSATRIAVMELLAESEALDNILTKQRICARRLMELYCCSVNSGGEPVTNQYEDLETLPVN